MSARERLPNRRPSTVFEIEVHGMNYTVSFSRFADGRAGDEIMLIKADGTAWGRSEQLRPMAAAVRAARIDAEAAAAWRKEHKNPKADEAKELARLAEWRQQRSRRAAARAVASPDHVSNRRRELA